MIIGLKNEDENKSKILNSKLRFDKWEVKYVENSSTGEAELKEQYLGQTDIENVKSQKYLGFVL